ncbi:MAG: phosphoglucosamine mutase [Pirellulales bacterium]|nr:phosphoglucosamine mutase [Pirellulales bacterium]
MGSPFELPAIPGTIPPMHEPIISVSGLRGIVGLSLTPEIVSRYVAAFVESLPAGPVVITRDGRGTGLMVAAAVKAALMAAGRTCLDADLAATPTTGVLVRHLAAAGGIQISASHNPAPYNGLKLLDRSGRVLPAAAGQEVLDRYRAGSPQWQPHDQLGACHQIEDTVTAHLALVAEICDVARIRQRGFRTLIDSNHGAGGLLGVALLQELGCTVNLLGGEADGQFGHPPEPTEENLAAVLPLVPAANIDIGFCQDPDADRLAVIDETGRYLGEEYTLALCADHVLRHRPGPVVTNCSTSRMTQDLAEKYGVPYFRSKVGEANVVDLMLTEGAVLGGEGNGGVIDPRVGQVRDSFVGMALLLDAMAAREAPVSSLADEVPGYTIHKTKVDLPAEQVPAAVAALATSYADATADHLDGLRLDWPDKWILVRASNTEPIVRMVAEAKTAKDARCLCAEAAGVLSAL